VAVGGGDEVERALASQRVVADLAVCRREPARIRGTAGQEEAGSQPPGLDNSGDEGEGETTHIPAVIVATGISGILPCLTTSFRASTHSCLALGIAPAAGYWASHSAQHQGAPRQGRRESTNVDDLPPATHYAPALPTSEIVCRLNIRATSLSVGMAEVSCRARTEPAVTAENIEARATMWAKPGEQGKEWKEV
jgi:hypothetical protein